MLFNTVYNLALNLLVELSFDIPCNPTLKTDIFNKFTPLSFPPPTCISSSDVHSSVDYLTF